MVAEDLRVGDYVTCCGIPLVVVNVMGDLNVINYSPDIPHVQEENYIDINELEPIPLTPEILKKSGFGHCISKEISDWFDGTEGNMTYVFNKTEYGYMSCIDVTGRLQ